VEEPFWNVDTIFYTDINTDLVLPRYVYHYLKKEHLERLNTAGGVPSLTQAVLNKVEIPVPPLEIQQEIVRILDNFTELSAELAAKLEAEIAARKKQYEYYRDALLTFDATGETIFTDRQTDRT
jgi:type I restriction enzyme specificity protein (fragment)